jgi:hypothetical protein
VKERQRLLVYACLVLGIGGGLAWKLGDVGASTVAGAPVDTPEVAAPIRERPAEPGLDVKIERIPQQGGVSGSASRTYESRQPTDTDLALARKWMGVVQRCARSPDIEGLELIDKELRIADARYTHEIVSVALALLDEGAGFVTKDLVDELVSDDRVHFWNIAIGRRELLYVPIDLDEYPSVKGLREKFESLQEFKKNDRAYTWNSSTRAERQRLIHAAEEAKASCEAWNVEAGELMGKKQLAPLTAAEQLRLDELVRLGNEARDAVAKVPPRYDPVSLDWIP